MSDTSVVEGLGWPVTERVDKAFRGDDPIGWPVDVSRETTEIVT